MPNLLILYPWGVDTIRGRSNGAGSRVSMLASFLQEHGHNVTVVSIGRRSKTVAERGITYTDICLPRNPVIFLLYAAASVVGGIKAFRGIKALSYFLLYRLDKSFTRQISLYVQQHDLVLLEYPFWGNFVCSLHKPTILTNHDVVAKAWCDREYGVLCKIISRLEIAAMQAATKTVAVSESDCRYFTEKKVEDVTVIPNPVREAEPMFVSSDTERWPLEEHVRTLPAFDRSFRSYAIFVGSGWYPNRAAVDLIVNVVAPRCPDIGFVLAGKSSESVSSKSNVFALGLVAPEELVWLYHNCTFALIIVPWGTGTSMKTLEALSYSKVVISTPAGVRGFPFVNGKHGVVCERAEDFPEALYRLLQDEKSQHTMMKNGLLLAQQFDFRRLYPKYLALINELIGRRTV